MALLSHSTYFVFVIFLNGESRASILLHVSITISFIHLCNSESFTNQSNATLDSSHRFPVALGVDRDDVSYFLFNKDSYNVQIDDSNLDLVDTSLPVIFITHGWVDDSNDSWVDELTDAYLEKGDVNVITVDWSGPAGEFYPETVGDVKYIGIYTTPLYLKRTK